MLRQSTRPRSGWRLCLGRKVSSRSAATAGTCQGSAVGVSVKRQRTIDCVVIGVAGAAVLEGERCPPSGGES